MWRFFKQLFGEPKEMVLDIKAKQDFKRVLEELYFFLRDEGLGERSKYILQVVSALETDNQTNFLKLLKNVELWGGSGSLFDFQFYGGDNLKSSDEKNKKLHFLLYQLLKLMKDNSITFRSQKSLLDSTYRFSH